MRNKINTTADKRQFIKGLAVGKRTISELQTGAALKHATFFVDDNNPDEVRRQDTGETLNRKQANAIADELMKQKCSGPVVHWVRFTNFSKTSN